MLKKAFLISLVVAVSLPVWSQSELNSYFLKDLGANQYLNPANNPDATFSWYLPNLYYTSRNEGTGIVNLLKDNILNLSNIEADFKDENSTLYGVQLSLGSVHFNFDIFNFHLGHNLKYLIQADYNYQLFDVLLNGNSQYIGETIHVGPYINQMFYNEFFFGTGVKLDNLQLGFRVKRLNGYSNFYTPKHDFSIHTSDEIYQLEFNTEYHIYTNLNPEELNFVDYLNQLSGNFTGNGGWGFDFGLRADILDQVTISASLLDMGTIHWQNSPTKLITEGNFQFDGFDLNDLLMDSLNVIKFDSLAQIINVTEINESYRAGTPVQFYLGLQYYPTEEWEINALYYNAYSTGRSIPAVYLAGKYKPSEKFHTSLSYTWNKNTAVNIGWGVEAHLDWFHTFLVMDNIIDIFRPVGGNYFNIRAGVQVDFVR